MVILRSKNGRCDARCYDAETDRCHCICGGANHGAGLRRAVENNRAVAATLESGNVKIFDPWKSPKNQPDLF